MQTTDTKAHPDRLESDPKKRGRWTDVALLLAAAAIVMSIGVHAPGHSYSYAQMRQMGATVGMIESGNWILPHNHEGRLARKPQLYSWLTAPVLLSTGVYNDFTFRWPSTAAALGCTLLVYLLGMRWCDRRTGLLAGLLWATSLHMGKLMYLGTTDMLNTFWIMLAILCADRVLFDRSDQGRPKRWVVGLWVSIIMGAMTKGWGVANLPLIAGWIALTTGLGPGFKSVKGSKGFLHGAKKGFALLLRRWRDAAKRIRLLWGMLAFAGVLGPIWGAMFYVGGEEFAKVIQTEIWKRIFGGQNAPKPSSIPTASWLLFYTLPGSALAIGAMTLDRPRKWLAHNRRTARALWWIIAVVLPFSLAHGFRPDYLLPCYVSVAILGASGVTRLSEMRPEDGRWISILRHLFAFVVIAVCVFDVGAPLMYLYHESLPGSLQKAIRMPACVAPETWVVLAGIAAMGLGLIATAVWASLKWRIKTLAAVLLIAVLGVLFIDRHMISRHAQTGDGEAMIEFARKAGEIVGDDEFAVCGMEKAGVELYWGRFGRRISKLPDLKEDDCDAKWFITCDLALTQLNAWKADPTSSDIRIVDNESVNARPDAELVGVPIELHVNHIVGEDNMGKLYLFRLQP